MGSIDLLSTNLKDVYIYNNLCDKGFDYEVGFGFDKSKLPEVLKERNIVIKDNLISGIKNKSVYSGQFDAKVVEYVPEGNVMGIPKFRDLQLFDFVPIEIKKPIGNEHWKYKPSPWFGAFKPTN